MALRPSNGNAAETPYGIGFPPVIEPVRDYAAPDTAPNAFYGAGSTNGSPATSAAEVQTKLASIPPKTTTLGFLGTHTDLNLDAGAQAKENAHSLVYLVAVGALAFAFWHFLLRKG